MSDHCLNLHFVVDSSRLSLEVCRAVEQMQRFDSWYIILWYSLHKYVILFVICDMSYKILIDFINFLSGFTCWTLQVTGRKTHYFVRQGALTMQEIVQMLQDPKLVHDCFIFFPFIFQGFWKYHERLSWNDSCLETSTCHKIGVNIASVIRPVFNFLGWSIMSCMNGRGHLMTEGVVERWLSFRWSYSPTGSCSSSHLHDRDSRSQ